MPFKVDFDIELAADADIYADSVRPGQELNVAADEAAGGQLQCSTADGVALGVVPEAAARQLYGALKVTVRSVKKRHDAPCKVAGIQARAVQADGAGTAPQPPAPAAATQPEEDPSGYSVTVSQLQRLADDPAVALALKDERLQQLLLRIDGAADREKALEAALVQDPPFQEFADRVLATIAGQGK